MPAPSPSAPPRAGQASRNPWPEPPPDAAALVAQLVDDQARAEQLAAQLHEATAHSRELADALAAVTDKAAHDARSARRLARQLDGARAKLLELQRQLASQPPPPAATLTLAAPSAPTAIPPAGEPDDHEPGDD